ncbi:MAG: hypothetical protein D6683_03835, partial [Actinomyces sp.]
MVTAPLDLELTAIDGDRRSLDDWLTTFPLVLVALDPYTHESAWLLHTAHRLLDFYGEADVRTAWVLTCDADDARRFLGPYATEILTFADPDRSIVTGLGLTTLPAIVFIRLDGVELARAEGWNPDEWRSVTEAVSDVAAWTRPLVPAPGDPA